MSWLSSGLKKVRKAVGLPPITLKSVVTAAAPFIPGGGVIATVLNREKGGAPAPSWQEQLKTGVEGFFDVAAQKGSQINTAVTVGENVQAAQSMLKNPVVLALGAGVLFLLLGKR